MAAETLSSSEIGNLPVYQAVGRVNENFSSYSDAGQRAGASYSGFVGPDSQDVDTCGTGQPKDAWGGEFAGILPQGDKSDSRGGRDMDIFKVHGRLIADYKSFTTSSVTPLDPRIAQYVKDELA